MPIFALRTPSSNKPWEKNSRHGAKKIKKLEQLEHDGPNLCPEDATNFRALAAGPNYLAQDRPDLAFVAKEMCREFAIPTVHSYERLTHLCKYPGVSRIVYHYPVQPVPTTMSAYADTNFAGCKSSRSSTSGGVIMLGAHCIKHWSTAHKQVLPYLAPKLNFTH